jgi:hypothetical protein
MAPKGAEGSGVAAEHHLTEDQIAEFKEVCVLVCTWTGQWPASITGSVWLYQDGREKPAFMKVEFLFI